MYGWVEGAAWIVAPSVVEADGEGASGPGPPGTAPYPGGFFAPGPPNKNVTPGYKTGRNAARGDHITPGAGRVRTDTDTWMFARRASFAGGVLLGVDPQVVENSSKVSQKPLNLCSKLSR